ncbi:MAG TPA: RDD family protein [Steroidobacteraceae bacterium]|nr:RDD family protein [Steroidobacteraceae bacterium]
MNRSLRSLLLCFALVAGAITTFGARAQQQQPQPTAEQQEQPATPAAEEPLERADRSDAEILIHRSVHSDGNVVVNLWGDARLLEGEAADGVIAIFGDAHVDGEVEEAVVTIFGNAHVKGPVHGGVVSLFGNVYIDGPVHEAAVAVLGDLELGPNARLDGDIAVVGGKLTQEPGAVVRGHTEIMAGDFAGLSGLRLWIEKCLFYARPLAFDPGLGWAWAVAFGFLLFYVVLALLFDRSVERCVETLETQPGQSAVASIMTVLLVPVLIVLLIISVIGIAILPFVGMGLVCAGLFGKAVALAALGRRVTRFTGIAPFGHVAFATFVGGLIALALYVIPVVGLIAYKLLGIVGLGVVCYTILLSMRQRSASRAPRVDAPVAAAAAPIAPAAAEVGSNPAQEPASAPASSAAPIAATAAPRAGFWIRMGALLIDIILVSVIVNFLGSPDEFWLIAIAGYGALMWKLKSTTIGGLVCGIKVVRRDGAELNWDTAIVRALGCFLSLIAAGLGFLWIVFDDDRQAWHDKIAGTLVVRTPRPESLV